MTEDTGEQDRAKEAERLKQAWYAGFTAARHYPNHSQPVLKVTWQSGSPDITPDWSKGQRRPGWIS